MAHELTLQEFKEKIFDPASGSTWNFKGERPVLIDFYADWCGPCRMVGPVVEKLGKEYAGKIDVYKVDTEAEPELAALFRVSSIPSLLFIPMEGQPSMSQGAMPEASFRRAFEELFNIK